ncbi:zeta toxin family protein [Mucilaginibacter angelicae]|uniref:Zeta toxin family protein n=1 Tax=Mucilaginibacter angelicae TaxID=869718 RepID=A0ABV6L3D1_9SPHI
MDYSKPTLLVISGPNGAGKSTHIQTMLPEAFTGIWSFDRDQVRSQFETELLEQQIPAGAITKRATEMMEEKLVGEMKKAIATKNHFVLETPLSHADYWRYLDLFEANGYQIQLNYLCLDKVGDCIGRVGQRVLEGGHYVAPDTIKGVYQKNLEHINEYRKTFKVIELYDGMKVPTLLARIEDGKIVEANEFSLKKKWIKQGLPDITLQITAFLSQQKVDLKPKSRLSKRPKL